MTIRQNIRRPNFLSHPGRKEPIRQEKTEEVDQSGNGKVAHSGVKSQSEKINKVVSIERNRTEYCSNTSEYTEYTKYTEYTEYTEYTLFGYFTGISQILKNIAEFSRNR